MSPGERIFPTEVDLARPLNDPLILTYERGDDKVAILRIVPLSPKTDYLYSGRLIRNNEVCVSVSDLPRYFISSGALEYKCTPPQWDSFMKSGIRPRINH